MLFKHSRKAVFFVFTNPNRYIYNIWNTTTDIHRSEAAVM